MLEWFNQFIVSLSKEHPHIYPLVVVLIMAGIGTACGLLADVVLKLTGIKFDEYTDSHVK